MAKTYEQAARLVANRLGEQAYHNAMGGSMHAWYGVDSYEAAHILAIIYNKDAEAVQNELDEVSMAHYKSHWPAK